MVNHHSDRKSWRPGGCGTPSKLPKSLINGGEPNYFRDGTRLQTLIALSFAHRHQWVHELSEMGLSNAHWLTGLAAARGSVPPRRHTCPCCLGLGLTSPFFDLRLVFGASPSVKTGTGGSGQLRKYFPISSCTAGWFAHCSGRSHVDNPTAGTLKFLFMQNDVYKGFLQVPPVKKNTWMSQEVRIKG